MASIERKQGLETGSRDSRQSFSELVGFLIQQVTALVKDEIALASAQLQERTKIYASAATTSILGIGFALLSGMALLTAAIVALAQYAGLILSSAIFGVALAAPAIALIMRGRRLFKHPSNE